MPDVTRRRLVAGAAWAVPVVLVSQPAAAAACSGPVATYTPGLSVTSSTTTKIENGHTIGDLLFNVRNDGTQPIPAGTTYTATITAEKAPGSQSKNITVTPKTTPGISPTGATSFNPDGGAALVSQTYSLLLPAAVPVGDTFSFTWGIDSETGIGATKLRLDVTLVGYGTGPCGATTAGTPTSSSAYWGAR